MGVGKPTVCFGAATWVQRELSFLPFLKLFSALWLGRRLVLIWRFISAMIGCQTRTASKDAEISSMDIIMMCVIDVEIEAGSIMGLA